MSEQCFKPVKTAIIGCGMISDIYIRNLKHLFSVIDLVALCNRTRATAEASAARHEIEKVMTLEEIAADPEIELVVNLTPAPAHYGVIKQMLTAGKHVYTEKMFTTDLEQARELVSLAESKGLMIAVAPDTVLGAGIQTARKLIDTGMIGTVTSGVVSVIRNQNLNSEYFRFLQGAGGALPYDVGIYYIGALVVLLGSVKSVSGFGAPSLHHKKQILRLSENPDSWTVPGNNLITAALEFESGALVSIHFNGNTIGCDRSVFELYGTAGALELGDPNTFGGPVRLTLPESDPVQMPFTHGYDGHNYCSEPASFDHGGNRGVGAAELAWAIRNNRPNRLSKEYGLHCQEILQGIDEAVRTGTAYQVQSRCEVAPLKSGYFSSMFGGGLPADAERSLME